MITYEKGKSVLDKEVNIRNHSYAWFLGEKGEEDLLPLMTIWQNCNTSQWVLGEHKINEVLCSFFELNVLDNETIGEKGLVLDETGMPKDLEGIFFIGVTKKYKESVQEILEKFGAGKQFYFCSNKENGYYYKKNSAQESSIIVPEEKEYPSIYIEDIPEEERVLFSSQLFSMEETPVFSLSYYLKKLFLNSEGGSETPFNYLNNLYIDSRKNYNKLVGRAIPFEKGIGQYGAFLERPLSYEEKIESALLRDDFKDIQALVESYVSSTPMEGAFIYNVLMYIGKYGPLNITLPLMEKVIGTLVKYLREDQQIDLLTLLGELYLKEGSYQKAEEAFMLFANSTIGESKKGCFYQRAVKALLDGGLYDKALITIKSILSKKESFLKEDRDILESFLLYICNQKKNWILADTILKEYALEEPRDLILKEIINYNQGKYNLEEIDALLSHPSIKDEKTCVAMVTYLKILVLEKEGESLETLKLFNRIKEGIGDETNPAYRRWCLLCYLNKGLITAREAKIFEGINILKEGTSIYGDDVEVYTKRILKKALREKAFLEMKVGEYETALMTIEDGLLATDEASFYEGEQKGYFLLYKLEILGILNRSYDETCELLMTLLKKKKGVLSFQVIESAAFLLKESSDLKRGEEDKGLEAGAFFWEKYKDNKNEIIEKNLLDSLLFERDWLSEKEHTDSLILTLKKISEKYKNHENKVFFFEAGKSLYELGAILIKEGNRKEGIYYYDILLEAYRGTEDKALIEMMLKASYQKGIYLYEEGELKAAKPILEAFKDTVMKEAANWLPEKERCLFVLASIEESEGHKNKAIDGFELYVSLFKNRVEAEKGLLDAYWHLSQLFILSEKTEGALAYLDLIIENGTVVEEPYLMLNAYKEKAKYLFQRNDTDNSRKVYETIIELFSNCQDEVIIGQLSEVYRKLITMAKNSMDFNKIKEDLEKVILILDQGTAKEAEQQFKVLVALSDAAALHKAFEVQKWAAEAIIKDFESKDEFQYKKGVAKSYYDLLVLATIDDDLDTIEATYKQLGEKTKNVSNDMVKEYFYEGQRTFAIELFKRGYLDRSEVLLKDNLKEKNSFLGHYYLGRLYEQKALMKKALKAYADSFLFKKILTEDDLKVLYYDAFLRKTGILSQEKSLFKKNMKKALKEMEDGLEIQLLNENNIIFYPKQALFFYQKGKLLLALGEKEKGYNTLKKGLRLFDKDQNQEVETIISKIYEVLDK